MRLVVATAALGLTLGSGRAIAQVVPEDPPRSADPSFAADMHTGLGGRVVLASRCSVPLGGDDVAPCPTLPLATAVVVRSADGATEVARVATDADGQFTVPLDPGQYLVVVPAADGLRPTSQTVPVTIGADGPTTLTIQVRPDNRTQP